MAEPVSEPFPWRSVHGVIVVLVVALFLWSLRTLLNPFLLFGLLLLLVSPTSGSRPHLLLVGSAGALTAIWLLETTGFLLAPFILALVLAYVLQPLVSVLERRGVPRGAAIFLLVLPLLLALGVGIAVGVPALSRQIAHFIQSVPSLIGAGTLWVERLQAELLRRDLPWVDERALLGRLQAIDPQGAVEYLHARQSELARRAWAGVLGVGRGIGSVLSVLGYIFLTPILTFYLLRDYDRLLPRIAQLIPPSRRDGVVAFASEYDRLLAGYLRGQFLVAAIVATLTAFGLWIVGFPYALLLGVTAGVFGLVPYLGLIVSLIPAVAIALFSGAVLLSLGKLALVFTAVQLLEGSVISPRVVGEAVGLHPVWLILALAVSGYFFGFVGLLIAVPLAVLVKLLLREAVGRYERSALFQGEGARLGIDVVERGRR
ncbi:MAG: AI-2E family transporter [Gemmatimonadota bacterium]|jgi:predicted PurR-regulated permease PerM|nr:AI-2E family transporter [Gemmatimonadota bacterium]